MSKKEIGLYIHIPFCAHKCDYCDFISFANKEDKIEQYIKQLKEEINQERLEQYKITTIYIGGGTPSFIQSKYILEILKLINKKDTEEITIEINPGTVTKEKLQDYYNAGINRLSIGLQSTDNNILKQIGRIHTYEQFLETYNLARDVGFTNINIDLMIGLPNQELSNLEQSCWSLDGKRVHSSYGLLIDLPSFVTKYGSLPYLTTIYSSSRLIIFSKLTSP